MVTAEIVGLMEQTDGGGGNHNVVAVLPGDPAPDLGAVREVLAGFIVEVFRGLPGRESTAGRLLPVDDALAYLAECTPSAMRPARGVGRPGPGARRAQGHAGARYPSRR